MQRNVLNQILVTSQHILYCIWETGISFGNKLWYTFGYTMTKKIERKWHVSIINLKTFTGTRIYLIMAIVV